MKYLQVLLVVVISALIGYTTNVLAIKSLFRPIRPVKLGPFRFQGLIPKRRFEVARSIGSMVASELLSQDDLISQIIDDQDEERFRKLLLEKIQKIVLEKIAFLPLGFQDKILDTIEEKMDKESPKLFNEVKTLAEDHIRNKVDVGALIEEKINALDLERLEELILKISGKELRAIEWVGLLMGAGIGLIQGLLTVYLF
ncbi:Protein of uncharacterised function (DUF445) [Urinicoccus massiliensis]|uniref:Protein of uncharacterized function (DUF445) n=1 Tax=Urinicoccus massiliensis TaxID=1723382 RepID=A0A8H2QS73_9FIRM|nr:DUF445 family protein [Urinicoccus massiliensis]VFB15565.1 Protein of uncharacterised function (DUF445) [Urinicoccus massiliensis]